MIRINLIPQKRKKSGATPTRVLASVPTSTEGKGTVSFVLMLVGWLALGAGGWHLLTEEEAAAARVRAKAANLTKEANDIKAAIDMSSITARREEIKRQEIAIQKLRAKQRTPVFVMYEIASILTDSAAGGGPTKDLEKYNKNVKDDPQSEINERWDPSGLWLTSVIEENGRLQIEGTARDPGDLAEFTRRLRASVWFGEITHPNYERISDSKDKSAQRNLTWKLSVAVRRWN